MAYCLVDALEEAADSKGRGGEFVEKLNTLWAMYDGSYIDRLMEVGGKFDTMFAGPSAVWGPFGLAVIVAALFLGVRARLAREEREARLATFLLLSLVLITIGVLLLPGAVRMHHSTLVYPFPHLAVAAAIVILWKMSPAAALVKWGLRATAVAILCAVFAGHLHALWHTQALIQATGGRGRWTNAIETFCSDVKGQPDLPIVSLDWGFNEQLCFLTDRKNLSESFWSGELDSFRARHLSRSSAGIRAVSLRIGNTRDGQTQWRTGILHPTLQRPTRESCLLRHSIRPSEALNDRVRDPWMRWVCPQADRLAVEPDAPARNGYPAAGLGAFGF